jgi:hypothetical protein
MPKYQVPSEREANFPTLRHRPFWFPGEDRIAILDAPFSWDWMHHNLE